MTIDRRNFLKTCGLAAGTGFFTGAGLATSSFAQTATKKNRVLIIGLHGGITPILGNAAAFPNIGWMQGREASALNQVSWDSQLFSGLMDVAAPYFAVAGSMGSGSHDGAKNFWYENNQINKCFPVMLGEAMGGNNALKVAGVGSDRIPEQRYNQITDIASYLDLVGNSVSNGGGAEVETPNYQLDAALLQQTQKLSASILEKNPIALNDAQNGLKSIADAASELALNPPPPNQPAPVVVNPATIMADYGLTSTQIGGSFSAKLAAAEIMMRTGVNVVTMVDEGGTSKWDTHDDNNGARARALYQRILPSLTTFCRRMLGTPDYNTTIVFVSEHSRIVEKSNHGPHTAIPIFSDSVMAGRSTGRSDNKGLLMTPYPEQNLRALVSDLAKVNVNPFGNHQHSSLIKT